MKTNQENLASHKEIVEQAAERLAQIFIMQIDEENKERKKAADDG